MEKNKVRGRSQGFFRIILLTAFCMMCMVFFNVDTVHAQTKTFDWQDESYSIDVSDSVLAKYPYIYVIYDSYQTGIYDIYLTDGKVYSADKKGHFVSNENQIGFIIYEFGPASKRDFVLTDTNYYNKGTWDDCKTHVYQNGSGSYLFGCDTSDTFVYSNTNIQYADYDGNAKEYTVKSDSFFIPSLGVSIKMVQEIPAEVVSQIRAILPEVLFCLALLIGCLTLVPRLRHFLA